MKNIAIITGASSGLGAEFAVQIERRYALDEIWLIARRQERLQQVADRLQHTKARLLTVDVSEQQSLEKLKQKLEEEKPAVRILVNSAGFGKIGTFEELDLSSQMDMVDVNIKGVMAVTYEVLPYMRSKSKIIQVASAAAFLPQPNFNVYAATKAFVLHFAKALGVELRHRKIQVLAVCPGPVNTEFFDIASLDGKPVSFKDKFIVQPKDVVYKALTDLKNHKAVSVYSATMQAGKVAAKLIPHRWILKWFKFD